MIKYTQILSIYALSSIILFTGCASVNPEVPSVENYMPKQGYNTMEEELNKQTEETANTANGNLNREIKLTLETAVEIALDQNPLKQSTEESTIIAKERVGEARAPYFPELSIETGYSRWESHAFLPDGLIENVSEDMGADIPSKIGPTNDWFARLKANYILFDSGKRAAELRATVAEQVVAEEEASKINQDIALIVHQAFYNLVAAQETVNVSKKNLARAENHLRIAKERKTSGDVSRADVIRAQVEVADAKLLLDKAKHLVRIYRGELNKSMGFHVQTPIEINRDTLEILSPEDIDINKSVNQAVHERAEIKSSLYRIEAEQNKIKAAKSAFGPKVNAEGWYGKRDEEFFPTDEDWLVGVSIEIPLFKGFSRTHKLARTKAELRREEADTARLVLDIQQEVWSAYSNLKEAYQAIQTSEVKVNDAREGLRITKERYLVGASTINDLLDTQTDLAKAETDLVEAFYDYQNALAKYKRATGSII